VRRGAGDRRETAADADGRAGGDAIVVDPGVAGEARRSLARMPAEALFPYRGPVPVPKPPERDLAVPAGGGIAVASWAASAAAAGTGFQWALNMLVPVALCATLIAIAAYRERRVAARRARNNPAITCHRRYVRPAADIDPEYRGMWDRAAAAGTRVAAADVVRQQLVDSIQVEAVLPERLWEIAERLARLSEARARHREILSGGTPDDPGVVATVERQRRVQDLAAADVARRVQSLEALADLLAEADGAARAEAIARELADLSTIHADLLAGVGETVGDADFAERMADDAAAVIDQAREAASRAGEAAVALDLPDEADGGAGAPLRAGAGRLEAGAPRGPAHASPDLLLARRSEDPGTIV
jgi:hypothetical protein